MECCEQPQIETVYDPASDGKNYRICLNCGKDDQRTLQSIMDEQRVEIARLQAALKEAEAIRDDLVSVADNIGETIFMDYAETDPTGSGNDRYDWVAETGICLSAVDLRKIAGLVNEAMNMDWVDTTGDRQRVQAQYTLNDVVVSMIGEPVTKVLRTDTIECPSCGLVQQANVTQTDGDPWPSFTHKCQRCGYIIMESEWSQAEVEAE